MSITAYVQLEEPDTLHEITDIQNELEELHK